MKYAKKSVSLPQKMYDAAVSRAKRMGYETFSEYVQYLIRRDLEERPTHSVVREEPPEPDEVKAISSLSEAAGDKRKNEGDAKKIGFHKNKKFHKIYALDGRHRIPPRDSIEPEDLAVRG